MANILDLVQEVIELYPLRILITLIVLLFAVPGLCDLYVRPAGGTYGDEDGTSYVNALDGFGDITWSTVDSDDGKLFVCGDHEAVSTESLITGTDSDFSGASNWTDDSTAATVTMGYDSGDSGHDSVMRIESGDGSYDRAYLADAGSLLIDHLYEISFSYKIIDDADVVTAIGVRITIDTGDYVNNNVDLDTSVWTHYSSFFVATATTTAEIHAYANKGNGNASNEILFDSMTIKEIARISVGASGESNAYIDIESCTIANGASVDDPGSIDMTKLIPANTWIDDSANFNGAAVYKKVFGYRPAVLLLDDYVVHNKNDTDMDAGGYNTDFERLTGATIDYGGGAVSWWDSIDVIWGAKDTGNSNYTVYIRFRDGSDPNSEIIRIGATDATYSQAVHLHAQSYVKVKDLTLKGSYHGITSTAGVSDAIIDSCEINHARYGVVITEGTATVQNNIIELKYHGDKSLIYLGSGAESSENERYHLYYMMKYTWGSDNATYGHGIFFNDGSTGDISNNSISDMSVGIWAVGKDSSTYIDGLNINDNDLYNILSVGIVLDSWIKDVNVYYNYIENVYLSVRLHNFDIAGNTTWEVDAYRNVFANTGSTGSAIYVHALELSLPSPIPVFKFTNNTVSGFLNFFYVEPHLVDSAAGYLESFSVDNNIIQANNFAGEASMRDEAADTLLSCTYNYLQSDDDAAYVDGSCIEGSAPGFVDSANGNFHLMWDAPGVDAGVRLANIYAEDMHSNNENDCGNGWDIGGFPYCEGQRIIYAAVGQEWKYSAAGQPISPTILPP